MDLTIFLFEPSFLQQILPWNAKALAFNDRKVKFLIVSQTHHTLSNLCVSIYFLLSPDHCSHSFLQLVNFHPFINRKAIKQTNFYSSLPAWGNIPLSLRLICFSIPTKSLLLLYPSILLGNYWPISSLCWELFEERDSIFSFLDQCIKHIRYSRICFQKNMCIHIHVMRLNIYIYTYMYTTKAK